MSTIRLLQPIMDAASAPIETITLREPTYGDFVALTVPFVWVSLGGGGFVQETPAHVGAWLECLCDCAPEALEKLTLGDTLALRDALFDYFTSPRAKAQAGAAKRYLAAFDKDSATPN